MREGLGLYWQVRYYTPAGAVTDVGGWGEIDSAHASVYGAGGVNQVQVSETSGGQIGGACTYGLFGLQFTSGSWAITQDIRTAVLPAYAVSSDPFIDSLGASGNRFLLALYSNTGSEPALLLKSDDGAATWSILRTGADADSYFAILYANPANSMVIASYYTASVVTIEVSLDSGDTWNTVATLAGSVNPYGYGTRRFGQTTGSYTGAWWDMATGEVNIYEISAAGAYSIIDTFTDSAWNAINWCYVLPR
jgi:hypothetical protein